MKRGPLNRALGRLERLDLEWDSEAEIPGDVSAMLAEADSMLQRYWDQWRQKPIEQYVACDFRDVWRALSAVTERRLAAGNTFVEWGCGFGVVTGLASYLGWESVGIEAEPFLVQQAEAFLRKTDMTAQIVCGNFLPRGAERLAGHDANHASLFHQVPTAYDDLDLQCDDFSLVFAYPWPGEHRYLQEVFRTYAGDQALLLMFLGPYEIELFRKHQS
ncbi:class I SAM-dependent methyltransferase [Pirellulaceae bacterium SH467]|jgi:SAM-dependent methyltransferase